MNKRFMRLSFGIFMFFTFSLISFKFILDDKKIYADGVIYIPDASIKYKGFEENEDNYKIRISIKNNSEYYGIIEEEKLQFQRYSNNGVLNGSGPIFEGYDLKGREYFDNYNEESEEYNPFFNPYEEKVYIFEIPKGLSFDEKEFDTNRIIISYNIEYFKYKNKDNAVTRNITTKGGFEFLNNNSNPYKIK